MAKLSVQAATKKKIGRYLGYPECCLQAFGRDTCQVTKDKHPNGPWWGTGYVPCEACAAKCLVNFTLFVEQHIAPRRQAPVPFPQDSWKGSDAFFEKMWEDAEREERPTAKQPKSSPTLAEKCADRLTWGIIRTLSAVGVY